MQERKHPNYNLDDEPVSDYDGSDQSSSDEDFDVQEALDDWVLSLRLEQRKMLAVTLMESFKICQKMNVKEAASEAEFIVGFSEKSVRKVFSQTEENLHLSIKGSTPSTMTNT